jgi:hypothetical protein
MFFSPKSGNLVGFSAKSLNLSTNLRLPHYGTLGSVKDIFISVAGYSLFPRFSYGE